MNKIPSGKQTEFFLFQKVASSASKRKTKGDVSSLRKSLDRYKNQIFVQDYSTFMNDFKEKTKGIYHYVLVIMINILQADFSQDIPPMLREEKRDSRIFNLYAVSNYDKIFSKMSSLCFYQNPTKITFDRSKKPTFSVSEEEKKGWITNLLNSDNFESSANNLARQLFHQSENQISSILAFQFADFCYLLIFYYEKLSEKNMNAHHKLLDKIRENIADHIMITEIEEVPDNEENAQLNEEALQLPEEPQRIEETPKQQNGEQNLKLPNLDQ